MKKLKDLKRNIISGIIVGGAVLFIFLVIGLPNEIKHFTMIIPLFICIPAIGITNQLITNKYKDTILKQIIEENSDYKYERKNFNHPELKNSYLINKFATTFKYEDYIKGSVNGLEYESFDLHATHTSGGKNKTTITDFLGRYYSIKLPIIVPAVIILKEEYWHSVGNEFKRVEVESIEFNKAFNLYTSDVHETYKIFTPKAIQDLLDVINKLDEPLVFKIIKDNLYIAKYDKKSLFELADINDEDDVFMQIKEQEKIIIDLYDTISKYCWESENEE